MTPRSMTTAPPPQTYQHRQSTIGESGNTTRKYIKRSNIKMISICGRDNSLCKKMGTSSSPPPPAPPPLLRTGLAASSTELFIGRGAMMMMMMMMMTIEKLNEILLERELYRVGNDRRSSGKMIMIMIMIMIFVGRMIFSAITISTIWVLLTVLNTSYYERLKN
jgi:hypothetical protein